MITGIMNRVSGSIGLVAMTALVMAGSANFAAAQRLNDDGSSSKPTAGGEIHKAPKPAPLTPDTTHTFIPTITATWNNTANWDTGMIPNGIDEAVIFNTPTAAQLVTLDGAKTVGSFTLTNNSAFVFTLQNGTGGPLTFDVTTGNASLTINGTGNVVNAIGSSATNLTIVLNDTLDITVNDTATASITGALSLPGSISGAGGIIKNGDGRASLATSTKTYTGSTVVNAGALRVSVAGLPTMTSGVTVNSGGTLILGTTASGTWLFGTSAATVIDLNGTGSGTLGGALRADAGSGTGILSNNINLASDSAIFTATALQLNGVVSGSGGLTKAGSGSVAANTLTLTAANTYAGSTTISAGTLQLGNGGTTGSLSASSSIAISTGAIFKINRTDTVTQGTDFSSAPITGAGSLLHAGTGTVILNAANTYTGGTIANGSGVFALSAPSGAPELRATADGALGGGNVSLTASGVLLTLQGGTLNNYISDNATLSMVAGSTANLNFTGTDVISGLVLGGVAQSDLGTYGSTASGAMHPFDNFFLGTGTLTLIPEPSTWAMTIMGAGLLLGVQRFRRKS